jgi:hypothetical protein
LVILTFQRRHLHRSKPPSNGAILQAKAFKRAGNSVAVPLWLAYSHRIMRFFP